MSDIAALLPFLDSAKVAESILAKADAMLAALEASGAVKIAARPAARQLLARELLAQVWGVGRADPLHALLTGGAA